MNGTIEQIGRLLCTHMTGIPRFVGFLTFMCISVVSVAQDSISNRIPQAQLRRDRMAITITDTLPSDSTTHNSTTLVIPNEKAIRQFIDKKLFPWKY